MFNNKFICKNFLGPNEKNYKMLLRKIRLILKISSANLSRNHPIKDKKIKLNYCKYITNDNKEIPISFSSTKTIIKKVAEIFEGRIRWNSPFTLLNIAPSPLLETIAATTVASLYNQNALWDFTSGNIILYEKKVIKALTELIGWDCKFSEGLSTYGGKATLMYAIKIGLHKLNLDIINKGIKKEYFIIASDRAHYSIPDVCNFLGIGSKNLIKIDTGADGKMLLSDFHQKIERLLKENKNIACIILNAGTTIDLCIDPILDIKKIVNMLYKKYKKRKLPHIHADSVAGWVWLFFKDLNINKLDLKSNFKSISVIYQSICQIAYADSFSADFHKTGLSPYCSTFFVVKNHQDIYSITKSGKSNLKHLNNLGDFHIHHFSLENSRTSLGIVSAYVAIQKLGWTGFQYYLIKMLEIGNTFKKIIYNKIFNEFQTLPLIGFVPFYKIQTKDDPLPCYLIYPMCLYTNEKDIHKILNTLITLKHKFESNVDDDFDIDNISSLAVPPR